ncbi:general stress protein [Paenibacillus alginolyticus]|uniref:General stress protein n=1 Tax=Paenibacillus alginolyticus TaxID=59839 RepID=A0ABT4G7I2_9BACL|nr:general stress protein [Paenibacillus alginolyticus]MCY9665295.1 general stress protein [Paenibacillus alginolyticus]MCY9692143.1 general stress protein [Paenibacillus alginolyticus]MEC0147908.1 general stress protein [Paenibacillus alginolyticus]
MNTYTRVSVTSNLQEAQNKVQQLYREGFDREHIYVLTHSAEGTDFVANYTGAEQITIAEEGVLTSIANLFRSRGDELRAKMRALGVPEMEAGRLESELDKGKILVLATPSTEVRAYNGEDFQRTIL